jgi:competence protein ComEA
MFPYRIAAAALVLAISAVPALAQTTPAPAKAAPAAAAPMKPAMTPAPAAQPAATQPVAKKVNLNTGSADDLDSLPDVGKARTKVIMDERAKAKFKDWADFEKRMAGTSVNAGVLGKIKDKVSF